MNAAEEDQLRLKLAQSAAEWEALRRRQGRHNLFVRAPASMIGGVLIGWGLSVIDASRPFWLLVSGMTLVALGQLTGPFGPRRRPRRPDNSDAGASNE